MSGATAYHSGRSAEAQVAARYAASGHEVLHRRWRGQGGEIDLILRRGATVIFVEVKAARSIEAAAYRISPRQAERLAAAAEEYLGGLPDGALTEARFDVALVDRAGRIQVIENALGG